MRKHLLLAVGLALGAGPSVAVADSADEQQACMNDAFQFCGDAIPDRSKVFYCLVNNRHQISAACHSAMAAYLPPDQPVLAMKKPSPQHETHEKSAKTKGPLNITPH